MRTARFARYAFASLRRLSVAMAHPMRRIVVAGTESARAGSQVMHAVDSERVREAAFQTGRAALRSRYSYMALVLVVLGFVGRGYLGGLPITTLPVPAVLPVPGDPVEPLGIHLKPPLRRWTAAGMRSSWVLQVPRVKTTTEYGWLDVLTSPQSQAYQLMSPSTALPIGRYVAVVRGQVQKGGLTLGVLDAKSQKWVKTAFFTNKEEPHAVTMPVFFSLSKPAAVEIVLANYNLSHQVSHWRVRDVSINPYDVPAATARRR
jgi:hypothetical protein